MQRHLLRFGLLLLLAGSLPVATTLSSCSSDKKDDPQPTTGSLAGTISPAGSISKVTAIDAGGLTFLATPDATTGAFTIKGLKPGPYKLSFEPTTGYYQPGERNITIVAGEEAAAGTVEVESDGSIRSGTMSWSRNGTTYSATSVQGSFSQSAGYNSLTLEANTATGSTQDYVSFYIDYVPALAPGTYTLRRTTSPGGRYEAFYNILNAGIPAGSYVVDTGTLTITAYNSTTRVLTGTFAFNADGYNGTSGSVSISNGSFQAQF